MGRKVVVLGIFAIICISLNSYASQTEILMKVLVNKLIEKRSDNARGN